MATLLEFIFRLTFGLAFCMTLVNARLVTSGYFRNNLYVAFGLNVLASLVSWRHGHGDWGLVACPIALAASAYLGAAAWLYESPRVGRVLLVVIACLALAGSWRLHSATPRLHTAAGWLHALDTPSSGLLLGATLAAMLLGHWHLNAPGMSLAPLGRLIQLQMAAVVARGLLCMLGLALEWRQSAAPGDMFWWLIALRWLSGLCGALLLAVMARKALQVPNTQSATGILYVSLMAVFTGELAGLLLSQQSSFPL